jgi:hypothetical protein
LNAKILSVSLSSVNEISINRIVEIVQGIVLRIDTVIGQTGTMLKSYFPLGTFFDKRVTANTVLALICVIRFGSDAIDFVSQHITDITSDMP